MPQSPSPHRVSSDFSDLDPKAPLLGPQLSSAANDQLIAQLKQIKENTLISPPLALSRCTQAVLLTAAVCSGILYGFTSDEAAKRYQQRFPGYSGGAWFQFLPPICGAVSNALFNIESYFTLPEVVCQRASSTQPPSDRHASKKMA